MTNKRLKQWNWIWVVVDKSFRTFESFMYKGLFFIKMLTWKFIRSFACVDIDMDKAKLFLPFDLVLQKKGGTGRRLTYNWKTTTVAWFKSHVAAHGSSWLDELIHFFIKNPQSIHPFTVFSFAIYHSIVVFKLFCSCFVVVYGFIIVNRSHVFIVYE